MRRPTHRPSVIIGALFSALLTVASACTSGNPAPPPPQHTVNTSSPAFQARYDLARGRAVDWLRKQLKAEDLASVLKVVTSDATPQLINRIAGAK